MQSSTSIAHMILLLLFFVPIYATSSDFSLIEVDRYYPFNTSLTVFVKDNKTLGINSKSDWQCLRIYCDDESPSKKKLGSICWNSKSSWLKLWSYGDNEDDYEDIATTLPAPDGDIYMWSFSLKLNDGWFRLFCQGQQMTEFKIRKYMTEVYEHDTLYIVPVYFPMEYAEREEERDFSLIEVDRYYPFNTSLTVFVKDNTTLGIDKPIQSYWRCLRIYHDDGSLIKKKLGSICWNSKSSWLKLWSYGENGWYKSEATSTTLPAPDGDIYMWSFSLKLNDGWFRLFCQGQQMTRFEIRQYMSEVYEHETLYIMPVYFPMEYTQRVEEGNCGDGSFYDITTFSCKTCSANTYKKESAMCVECPLNTYSHTGASQCELCNCKADYTCKSDGTTKGECFQFINWIEMKASRRYAVNLNCILNLTEEWPGEPLFNSISFWSQEKDGEKAVELGSLYWEHQYQYVTFSYKLDFYGAPVAHKRVYFTDSYRAPADKAGPTRHNISIDMSDGTSLRFWLDGKELVRWRTCDDPTLCVSRSSIAKIERVSMSVVMQYENEAKCPVKTECVDAAEGGSEECASLAKQDQCRTDNTLRHCNKTCLLCDTDFAPFAMDSLVEVNRGNERCVIRVRDHNIANRLSKSDSENSKWNCLELSTMDGSNARVCWSYRLGKVKVWSSKGTELRTVTLPDMIQGEYWLWDVELVNTEWLAVGCQGVNHLFVLPDAMHGAKISTVKALFTDLEYQLKCVEVTGSEGQRLVSGDVATAQCSVHGLDQGYWRLDNATWSLGDVEGAVQTDLSRGTTTVQSTPAVGHWLYTCHLTISTHTLSANISLTVTGCGEGEECLLINDCHISLARLCDGSQDCRHAWDERICRGNYPVCNTTRPAHHSSTANIAELCTSDTQRYNKDLNIKCYNRQKYSTHLYTKQLSNSSYNFLPPCLPGIMGAGCEKVDMRYKFGAREMWLVPVSTKAGFSCRGLYGAPLVSLSAMGRCSENITYTAPVYCNNQGDEFITITQGGVVHRLYSEPMCGDYVSSRFQCTNNNCISTKQVCDMVDDCGDYSDEIACPGHYQCPNEQKYIPLSNKCDNNMDCSAGGDECIAACSGSDRRIIPTFVTRVCVWCMGFIALLLNGFILIEFITQLRKIDAFNAYINKTFIALIALGDSFVASYLLAIAVVDKLSADKYCDTRPSWISGSFCKCLGIISTFGAELSLVAMTMLSVFRLHSLHQVFCFRDLSKSVMFRVKMLVVFVILPILVLAATPAYLFQDYFAEGIYYQNSTLFPDIASKEDHIQAAKYATQVSPELFNWEGLRSLVAAYYSLGGQGKKVGFYGSNDICFFNYFIDGQENMTFPMTILLVNFACFAINVACYIGILKISNFKPFSNDHSIKSKDQQLHLKISVIVATDCTIWLTFITLCFLHYFRITDMSEYSKPCSLCVLPFASAANPIIFNGNMFFTKPKNMTVKQMGLWVVLLFGIGLSFGLELQ